ncbi:hypothetical protein [Bremerella sp.]|uniref:hypothetical protein n=1 Tax=Bremerella sp. TaxID=2795602 RepID=UPI003918F985
MSYDLFLKSETAPLTAAQFESYFSARPHYTFNEDQAFYENEDTGVYFVFEYTPDEESTVAFNLNYFRPHFFGLEAAPEVEAFVSAFNLSIDDPQNDGMGEGPFSVDGFLRGWNAGNQFGYRAILSQDEQPETHVYPTAQLERTWRWNLNRNALQDQAGDMIFVPRYMFFKGSTQARSAVVWPDACPVYLPKADVVIVIRDELSTGGEREITVVEWSAIESVVQAFPLDETHGHFRLDYEVTPDSVAQSIRSLPVIPHDPENGLANAHVLNAELVQENTSTG